MADTAIISHALAPPEDNVALRNDENIFRVSKRALDNVGLERDDIDAVVNSGMDAFDGITISSGLKVCPSGGYNKSSTRLQNGGVYAIHQAKAMIEAGKADVILVSSEDSTQSDLEAVSKVSQEPYLNRPLGWNYLHYFGVLANSYLESTSEVTESDFAAAAAKNYEAAARNETAHRQTVYSESEILESSYVCAPLRELEICKPSKGATAIVLASEEKARELTDDPVWIEGVGAGSTEYWHREPDNRTRLPALRTACEEAYAEANIESPHDEIDFAEIHDPVSPVELMAYPAIGLCDDGEEANLLRDGITRHDGSFPVNASGGTLATNLLNSDGLYKTIQSVMMLQGDDDAASVSDAERALVTDSDQLLSDGGHTQGVLVLRGAA
jgi:acetyl-CoA C-acetyltransferase